MLGCRPETCQRLLMRRRQDENSWNRRRAPVGASAVAVVDVVVVMVVDVVAAVDAESLCFEGAYSRGVRNPV